MPRSGCSRGAVAFFEMGKTDIREPEEVAAQHAGVLYRAFNLDQAGPDRIREMLEELLKLFERGVLIPLPLRCWDIRRAPEAFRFMSQARHVGKIVFTFPAPIDTSGTVLVTGGTGVLGGLLARHLVARHGVRSVLLASRSGADADGAGALREELESLGARVGIVACDVSDRDAVCDLLEQVPAELPLRGVVHTAAALDDGVIGSLTQEGVARVLAPKVDAAWHLHELTSDLDLSMFVLFSSGAATMGAPGQGNYAAANSFLDALATYRQTRGMAASSIAWGHWEQVSGLTGALGETDLARLARQGVLSLSNEEGLELFDLAQQSERPALLAMRLDMAAVRSQARAGTLPALMSALAPAPARREPTDGSLARRLSGVLPAERESVVVELVRGEVAIVLGHVSPKAIDPSRAFKELGFDSLASVELRNRLNTITGLRLPATVVFDHPNAVVLARHLLERSEGIAQPSASVPARAGRSADELVAIVGMSCRYPGGVRSPQELWEFVLEGRDGIGEFPADRGWELERLFDPDPDHPGTSYVRRGGFLYDAGGFDAEFFDIAPREALAMDPQQRLFLELSWEAVEDAGIDPTSLRGSQTGVFGGVSSIEYGAGLSLAPREVEGYLGKGLLGSVLCGRVSYAFGLEGPAVTVDTACSSSLVALHWACQSLRTGECSLALAGGVTVISIPRLFIEFSRQRGLAPDGRCKSFSDSADGAGFSDGVGVVVLERLSDALRNEHPVLAVVRASATNQDGASNGLTAPSGPSQERVIRQALANGDLSGGDVDAVEGHGTGTTLGDPIEAQALLATYGREHPEGRPLWLGSLKSNIGHTQAASGVAGVIKMVKALEHGVLPRTLHVDEPSRQVDWSTGSVSLLTEQVPWRAGERVRRAGISSFGISGTNAHVILEEPPPRATERQAASPTGALGGASVGDAAAAELGQPAARGGSRVVGEGGVLSVGDGGVLPWLLSGRGPGGLRGQAEALRAFLVAEEDLGAASVGLSLAGRAGLSHRAVVVGSDREGLLGGLDGVIQRRPTRSVVEGVAAPARRVAFVFPGQGGQWEGMALELLATSPVFAAEMRRCEQALSKFVDWSVLDVLSGRDGAPDVSAVEVLQPTMFAVMVSLAALWRACGIEPSVVVGHSQGEIAAAHVAGGLSLDDAARVVALRGRVLASLSGKGGMLSIALGVDDVLARVESWGERVTVAAVNGPSSVVVSGDPDTLREVLGACEADGLRARLIPVDYAAHSAQIELVRDQLLEGCADISPCSGDVPFYSTMAGGLLDTAGLDAGYWYENMRQPVRFEEVTRALIENGTRAFLEVGPHPVLSVAIQETIDEALGGDADALVVGSLRRDEGGLERFFTSLGELWVSGTEVDWDAVYAGLAAERVKLPRYAFQREYFWLGVEADAGDVRSVGLAAAGHPLLGAVVGLAGGEGWLFTGRVSLAREGWLADHAVMGVALFPGTGFVELVLRAGAEVGCDVVREMVLETPLVLPERGAVQLQVSVGGPEEDGSRPVRVFSRREDSDGLGGQEGWTRHASGVLAAAEDLAPEVGLLGGVWPPAGAVGLGVDDVYGSLAEVGLDYGPAFQGLRGAWRLGDQLFCEVCLPDDQLDRAGSFGVHPALFDAALHASALVDDARGGADETGQVSLPFSWGEVRLSQPGAASLRVCLSIAGGPREEDGGGLSLVAVDEAGRHVVSVGYLAGRAISTEQLRDPRDGYQESMFALRWSPISTSSTVELADRWVVLGTQDAQVTWRLRGSGASVAEHRNLGSLREALEEDLESIPDVVLLDVDGLVDEREETDREARSAGVAENGARGGRHAGTSDEPLGGRFPDRVQSLVSGVLGVLREWLADERMEGRRLVVLTRDALRANPEDDVRGLLASAVWGLVRSAQSESPERFVLIDVDGSDESLDALPGAVSSREVQLAIRDGELLAPLLTRVAGPVGDDMNGAAGPAGSSSDLGAGCSVLVTGGTSGLGALVARHLVTRHGVESLLLTSRQGPDAEGAEGLREELEALGARVAIVACDVSDREAVAALLEHVPVEFPLRGVVHSAAVIDDGVIDSLTPERVARVLAPKVDAAWHLHELTADLDLSMFVLFSSAAATLGSLGQGNYAAANAFLDSLAAYRQARGLAGVSMAWGLWAETSRWTAALSTTDHARITRLGISALSTHEGLDLFDTAIAIGQAQVIPVRLDLAALREQAAAGRAPAFLRTPVSAQRRRSGGDARASLMSRLAAVSETEREELVLDLVRGEVAVVLGHASARVIDARRAFKELGFDSLAAIELRNRMNDATGLRLAATLVFDHPTPATLARYLLSQLNSNGAAANAQLDGELERLEAAVAAIGPSSPAGQAVTDRLRALLARWAQAPEPAGRTIGAEEIDAASDEEIFALLDGSPRSASAHGEPGQPMVSEHADD